MARVYCGAGLLCNLKNPASPAHDWKLCAMLTISLSEAKVFFEVTRYAGDLVATPINLGSRYSSCRTGTPISDRSSYCVISCVHNINLVAKVDNILENSVSGPSAHR